MASPRITRRRALGGGLAFAALSLTRAWAQSEDAITFLAVGDWGQNGLHNQQTVADRMGETAREIGARFVISTGDNFYDNGVTGVEDPMWETSFEGVYTAASLQVPWYAALGNHDYRGDSQAQIAYSARSARWRMPARWFSVQQRAPDGASLEIFVIDTTPMIGGYYRDGRTKVAGQDVEGQLRWLDQALAASKADWKIVVGHHPIYSGGHATGLERPETPDLIARIDPILQRHRVPLYLNGHNHDLQHVKRGLTDYVCTGAGSKSDDDCAANGSDFCAVQPGFVACAVSRKALRVAYRDLRGAELHVIDIPGTQI